VLPPPPPQPPSRGAPRTRPECAKTLSQPRFLTLSAPLYFGAIIYYFFFTHGNIFCSQKPENLNSKITVFVIVSKISWNFHIMVLKLNFVTKL